LKFILVVGRVGQYSEQFQPWWFIRESTKSSFHGHTDMTNSILQKRKKLCEFQQDESSTN